MTGTLSGYYDKQNDVFLSFQSLIRHHPQVSMNDIPREGVLSPISGKEMDFVDDYTDRENIDEDTMIVTSIEGLRKDVFPIADYAHENW